MHTHKLILISSFVLVLCFSCKREKAPEIVIKEEKNSIVESVDKKDAITTLSQKMANQYEKAKQDFLADSDNVENIIWYGRRTAYLGKYKEAIEIYSDGIKKYPNEARLYRHRGHRYISIREFDKAIDDLKHATTLIEGKENNIEPDGLPNALNIPVSSLHGNIWYHLGLAYYLKDDMKKAYHAYLNCRNLKSNDDNTASSTNWLYMIQRRMGNENKAKEVLDMITNDMTIIENTSYYNLCRFYKKILPIDSLQIEKDTPQDDATRYGLANWFFYNGNKEKARIRLQEILNGKSRSSFGYIAAESDYSRYFGE
ncbi:hypothetical protein ATE84_3957 [Aquimarina sp. MAR_2010_214]|uniref:tetratricopeptide repeat protein n=1 Tax=Aquimarina sp. MAR_2010_214 TaxID=1250026 RepID=UPI000C709952|nr:hypothetical protein [Aquimarina sp. MAR_2010_214]PKV51857.1 hypothetical protein ATE84_3957 [Aquimarina sp. MAR_2010_214]